MPAFRFGAPAAVLTLLFAATAFAKGPPWLSVDLERTKDFGNARLRKGPAGVYRDGSPAFGTLDAPLPIGRALTLPEGSIVTFPFDGRSPPFLPNGAAVAKPLVVCGNTFGPSAEAEDLWLVRRIGIEPPKGSTYLNVFRSGDPQGEPSLEGWLREPVDLAGLALPKGSQLRVQCSGDRSEPLEWNGAFGGDTTVGAVTLRAGQPARVVFTHGAKHAATGTLARPGTLVGRTFMAGASFNEVGGGLTLVRCGPLGTAVLQGDAWIVTQDCGVPGPRQAEASKLTQQPTPRSASNGMKRLLPFGLASALAAGLLVMVGVGLGRYRAATAKNACRPG